ncbi:HNH endonuclease [Bacillus salinus]|uniref:HNH endonuclease n=1 Tax=Bacillus sp. HMF5848 TaxID=2495421 RepID=UPI0037C04148
MRKASRNTINLLKNLYSHSCQICGGNFSQYRVSIVEAHHIEPFSETQNHHPNNIVILCPTHHEAIHKAGGTFNRKSMSFYYPSGHQETLTINKHLSIM